MSIRIATFNIENLIARFDFTGYRNQLKSDRVLKLFEIKTEDDYQRLEAARERAKADRLSAEQEMAQARALRIQAERERLAAMRARALGY